MIKFLFSFEKKTISSFFLFLLVPQIQFGLVVTKTAGVIYLDCGYPLGHAYILGVYMFMMITLFSNFYIQTYFKMSKKKGQEASEANGTKDHTTEHAHANGESAHSAKKLQPRKLRRFD